MSNIKRLYNLGGLIYIAKSKKRLLFFCTEQDSWWDYSQKINNWSQNKLTISVYNQENECLMQKQQATCSKSLQLYYMFKIHSWSHKSINLLIICWWTSNIWTLCTICLSSFLMIIQLLYFRREGALKNVALPFNYQSNSDFFDTNKTMKVVNMIIKRIINILYSQEIKLV